MHTYLIKYYVDNSANTTEETINASSEYSAKQLILAKYPGHNVHILNVKMI